MLKIIKHCKEFSPALVTGQLLGLDVGSVLEVTNCFPFPVSNFHILIYSVAFSFLTTVMDGALKCIQNNCSQIRNCLHLVVSLT